jgi:exodeoxyribonuclease V gamma subunit
VWIELHASTLCDDKLTTPRADKLVEPWLRCLAAAACCPADAVPAAGILIGSNAVLRLTPPSREQATSTLHGLLLAFADGMTDDRPVPTAVLTGVAFLNDPGRARGVYEGNSFGGSRGERKDPSLSRLYPDYAALVADPQFETATRRLYQPYLEWLNSSVTMQALPDHVSMESHADE